MIAQARSRRRAGRAWLALACAAVALAVAAAWSHRSPLERLAPASAEPADPPGTQARTGSLAMVRGGPYLVGFLAATPARLRVGEHELSGSGLVLQRLVFAEPGPVALRFAAPAGARLLWNPPGRRGDPEYVAASSLSPEPPERARFGADVGAAWGEAALAWLALAIGLAAAGLLARRRLAQVATSTWIAMAAVLALALLVRLLDLGAAGQTWDEDVYWASGRNYLSNLLALDFSSEAWRWNSEHPPVTKLIAGLGALLADGYGPARALSAAMTALACALLVPIGARLGSRVGGVIAGVVAALTPHLIAHGQVVGHEAPSLLWWTLGMLLALDLHREGGAAPSTAGAPGPAGDGAGPLSRRQLLRRLIALGVVVGLAAGTRFIGGLLGPASLLVAVIWAPPQQRGRTLRWILAVVPLVSWLTFVAVWPLLWSDPIGQLFAAWGTLRKPHALEPFAGQLTNLPPASYFLRYLAATAPVGILIGGALYLLELLRSRGQLAARRGALTLAVWFALPLVVTLSPVRQDGVRYVLPSVMALSLAAGLGIAALAARWRRRGVAPPGAGLVAGGVIGLYLAWVCVRAHPYYLDYYNELVGGPAAVSQQRRFETAWWGEGVDRAVAYVNRHAVRGERVYRGCIAPVHLAWFRGDLWSTMTEDVNQADWIVTYAPATSPCALPEGSRRVTAVMHQGAVLAEVYRR